MKEKIIASSTGNFKVLGKDITITILYLSEYFSEYPKEKMKKDLAEIIEFQRTKKISKDAPYSENRRYEMYPFPEWSNELLKRGQPDFDFFIKTVNYFIPRILIRSIERIPLLIEKDQLDFTVIVVDSDQRGNFEFITTDPDISRWGYAFMNLGGTFLLGRLVFPWFYFKRIDYALFEKNLSDVLQLHLFNIKKLYEREYAIQGKIAQIMKENPKIWNKGLIHLYSLFCNLYTNGLAMFVEAQHRDRILLDLKTIKNFRRNMMVLASIQQAKKAEEFYIKNLETTEMQYGMGLLMCYFIGLNILRKAGKIKFLTAYTKAGKESLGIGEINAFIRKHKKLYLQNLDPLTYRETYSLLSGLNGFKPFLQLYEQACNELELDETVKIIWWSFYKELREVALRAFEKEQRADYKKIETKQTKQKSM